MINNLFIKSESIYKVIIVWIGLNLCDVAATFCLKNAVELIRAVNLRRCSILPISIKFSTPFHLIYRLLNEGYGRCIEKLKRMQVHQV
jgi:hypothetical protein